MALSKGPLPPLSRAEKIKKTAPVLQKSKCIAAIDFGTSSLSVAYTTPTDGKIRLVPLYKKYERIPNAILITIDHELQRYKVKGIGHRAQSMYSDLKENAQNFIYFEKLLEKQNSLDHTTQVSSFTGSGSYYLIEVIAFILTHLKKKLLTDHLKSQYKSTDFDWVITVPAIWKARARRMMREAAYMADLTSDGPGTTKFTPVGSPLPRLKEVNPEKLSLALEPEVAAIYAQHQSEVSGFPPQRYMVVDIGGGTVDITVHDKSNGRISVVLPPMGNTWGGTTINEALSELLQEIVDVKGFMSFIESDTSVKAKLDKVLEGTRKIELPLLESFIKHDNITEEARKLNMLYDPEAHSITIECDLLREKVQVDKIIECVRAAFDELRSDGIDTIYLVGGFGGCRFVSQKIEEAIAQHRGKLYDNIVCPVQPDLAVVSGAVMWRRDPSIIQSRVADATYGIGVGPTFDPSIHNEHYKYVDEDGVQRCDHVFKVFILKGEVIKDEVYKATFIPRYQRMIQDNIPIYCTTDDGVQYVINKEGKSTLSTVDKIGELVLDIPNPHNKPRKEREYNVFMNFRGTEIQARAQYSITGEEVKTVCDFLSKQDNNETESKL